MWLGDGDIYYSDMEQLLSYGDFYIVLYNFHCVLSNEMYTTYTHL